MKKCVRPRNLCLRLRHWLIRKLGGYTEQRVIPPDRRFGPPPVRFSPERVFSYSRFPLDEGLTPDEEKRRVEALTNQLVHSCVRQIVEKHLYVVTCEPDTAGYHAGFSPSKIYTMGMCVIPPRDWLKTGLGDYLDPYLSGRAPDLTPPPQESAVSFVDSG